MEKQMKEKYNSSEASKVTIKYKVWKELLALAGRQIDPARAEVISYCGQIADPYGVLAYEDDCIGRLYFARSPDTNIWIEFEDLPEATRAALWQSLISAQPDDATVPF